jgi:hypothetical protein
MVSMSEEKFEAWLKENADDYHRPPTHVPREEMWETIARARQAQRPSPILDRSPVASRRSNVSRRWSSIAGRWPMAVAATLLIGAGIGLGYWMRGPSAEQAPAVASLMSAADSAISSATYDVASVAHLTAVETMLTSFRGDQQTETQASLQRLARDLLATTRLLMDSPAAEDASRRQLLADLEYVLAQIVLLDPNAPAEDRALVDRAIAREQVLTRIRSSIPAGFSSGN